MEYKGNMYGWLPGPGIEMELVPSLTVAWMYHVLSEGKPEKSSVTRWVYVLVPPKKLAASNVNG